MTANVPIVLVQFLALAFFVVIAIGIALGAYAARSLKRAEASAVPAEAPAAVTTYEAPAATESAVESID
jgi:predicted lysophospholipase L1 biosynthesis ABC-type transport system permease subunit